jgi:hypothetical protein
MATKLDPHCAIYMVALQLSACQTALNQFVNDLDSPICNADAPIYRAMDSVGEAIRLLNEANKTSRWPECPHVHGIDLE